MNKKFIFVIIASIILIASVYSLNYTDNSQSDFNNGTYNRTFYNTSGFVQLNATYNNGTFISRIFNSTGKNINYYELTKNIFSLLTK